MADCDTKGFDNFLAENFSFDAGQQAATHLVSDCNLLIVQEDKSTLAGRMTSAGLLDEGGVTEQ